MALSRTIGALLYETNPLDPLVYSAVLALLLGATVVACLVPAIRASRVDPVSAIRNE